MLLTKRVKAIVNPVKELDQLSPRVLLHNLVEALNIDKDDGNFALRLREILLSILDALPDQAWDQDVYNRF